MMEPVSAEPIELVLSSQACTTGWTDWAHGELWVGARGALRVAGELRATVARAGLPTDSRVGERRTISERELLSLQSRHDGNHWIPWDVVEAAVAQRNLLTQIVRLSMQDRTIALWWPTQDDALDTIVGHLRAHSVPVRSARLVRWFAR